ncbi:hypothetical protein HanPI659440_Chr17g0666411 [Helianthus annuus]|nr:hypothetical protein HanPI659440_Chr17g0666411 [Helianthus annuus]
MAVFLQWVKKNGCLPDSGSRLPLKRVRIILESGCLPEMLKEDANGGEVSSDIPATLKELNYYHPCRF